MMARWLPIFFTAFTGLVSAQFEGWQENQVNASICRWALPRAAVVRDTVYLDGGGIVWLQGFSNGEYGPFEGNGNPRGLMYTLNFSRPFQVSGNVTALFDTETKALGGSGNADDLGRNFQDGGLLANDAQVSLFGGVLLKSNHLRDPAPDETLTFQKYPHNRQEIGSWSEGFRVDKLGDEVTRYVAYGAAVSAPSEDKAWYFSGLRSETWGPIFENSLNTTERAMNVSDRLISVNMERQISPVWTNTTLHRSVMGRANAAVVWVPVGEQGILVVIGGVTYPEFIEPMTRTSENPAQSKEESDRFMAVIDIYDVASGEWYKQNTTDGPTASTRGCAVVAPAQDYSSFNIYYYGGYDGRDATADFSDEVWVLSLPSFTWTKVSEERRNFGRAGHKCFMPYPDQMMIIGGDVSMPGSGAPGCLEGGLIQMFNLTSAEWMDEYHPEQYHPYGVPSAVRSAIGGDATGGATATTPRASGWMEDDLADIFRTNYDMSKISTYFPYSAVEDASRPTFTGSPGDNDDDDNNTGGGGGGGLPGWVAPTLGVVLGLAFVTAILVGICLWRKRRILKKGDYTEASTDENGMRILSWIRGQPTDAKAPTVTTDETSNMDMTEAGISTAPSTSPPIITRTIAPRFEMMDTAIVELPDTSRPPELSDTGLTPVEVIDKHTHFASPGVQPSAGQSYYGSVSGNEASTVSHSTGVAGMNSRSDSPSFGGTPAGPPTPPVFGASSSNPRVMSGVSGLSDREMGHLRQISEATVSSATDDGQDSSSGPARGVAAAVAARRAEPPRSVPGGLPGGISTPSISENEPVSPPTANIIEDSDDYISARRGVVSPGGMSSGTASPLRRSVFRESEDDMTNQK